MPLFFCSMVSVSIFLRVPHITHYHEFKHSKFLMEEISEYLYLRGIDHKYNLTRNPGEMRFVLHLYNDESLDEIKEELRDAFGKYKIMVYV